MLWSRMLDGHPFAVIITSAVTYGVCEEVARYLSFRTPPMRRRLDTGGAVAAGLGHGGTESIVFALPHPVGMIMVVFAPQLLPAGVVEQTLARIRCCSWARDWTGGPRWPVTSSSR